MKSIKSVYSLGLFFLTFFLFLESSLANYYRAIPKDSSGYALKTSLKNLLKKTHRDQGYSRLFHVYFKSDADNSYEKDGSILDIYSERPFSRDPYSFKNKNQKCGTYRKESDCFNREHLFPQSIFGKRAPMRNDFFHVFPTDGYVNGRRSRLPFGEVRIAKWTSKNGSQVGPNTFGSYRGRVFEPIDEFKGDVARAMLYFATRYEDRISSWRHEMLNGSSNQVYKKWFINLLISWHEKDPVSKHEIQRNQAGYEFQGNRNPFIDHPEWVKKIWKR